MSEYLDFDCKNCGRHRVESNGICEKCNFDNIHNEFAQPILECLEHGAGTCRNENLIAKLRAEITRLKEENHALDQINRDIQTAAAHLDEVLAEIDRLSELLHDEMSQLEIATDLGNKRWLALNEIYENGEKHNANWCKRKAQEGLGIR